MRLVGKDLKITKFLIPAKVAHLVEHDLAKVGVAGSSPVFRSLSLIEDHSIRLFLCVEMRHAKQQRSKGAKKKKEERREIPIFLLSSFFFLFLFPLSFSFFFFLCAFASLLLCVLVIPGGATTAATATAKIHIIPRRMGNRRIGLRNDERLNF